MCDCTSEEDDKPEIQARYQPINNDDAVKSCDCTSEDDDGSEPQIEIHNETATNVDNLQSNVNKSCDCTSDDDGASDIDKYDFQSSTTKSCDCTSEEDGGPKVDICNESAADKDNLKSPFAIVQVELGKSVLNLLSSTESSASCDCTSASDSRPSKVSCPSKELASCDCSSESEESSGTYESEEREPKLECTLAIVKPEAVIFRKEIERIIEEEGFSIGRTRWLQLTPEQASEFYCDNDKQKDFARLVTYMSSKPIVVLVLCKLDAIREWRMLIGPTKVTEARRYAPDSIRGKYGTKGGDDDLQNAVHGSCDERAAEREIHFFFPDYILEPILRDEAAEEYLWKKVNGVLSEGLVKCCEAKPEDPVLWLGNWLLDNEAARPKYL